jgi:hypothetical protein
MVLSASLQESNALDDCYTEEMALNIVRICSVHPSLGLALTQRSAYYLGQKMLACGIEEGSEAFNMGLTRLLMCIISITTSTLGGMQYALTQEPEPLDTDGIFDKLDFNMQWNDDIDL